MAIITVAIGVALVRQADVSMAAAAAIAAVAGALLFSLHGLARRVIAIERATLLAEAPKPDHNASPAQNTTLTTRTTADLDHRQRPEWANHLPQSGRSLHEPARSRELPTTARDGDHDTDAHAIDAAAHAPENAASDRNFLHLQGLIKQLAHDVNRRDQGEGSADTGHPQGGLRSAGAPAADIGDAAQRLHTIDPQYRWLSDAISAERVNVYLDPIQGLAERKPRHFEVSVRLLAANGDEVEQRDVMAAARVTGLVAHLDAIKLPRVARVAHRVLTRGQPSAVLTPVSGESLAGDIFREAAARAIDAGGGGHLVLSYAQYEVRAFGPVHWEALDLLASWGMRFAIEDVVDLDMDFAGLKGRGFEFVKLDAEVLIDGMPGAGGVVPAADLCRYLTEIGMTLVVGHIDDEWTMARVLGFGVLYGQGALFGAPRPVRPDVVALSRNAA
jgi:cyclic-di-GMP phosphodiesterase TipF (flagellum assembly factor)